MYISWSNSGPVNKQKIENMYVRGLEGREKGRMAALNVGLQKQGPGEGLKWRGGYWRWWNHLSQSLGVVHSSNSPHLRSHVSCLVQDSAPLDPLGSPKEPRGVAQLRFYILRSGGKSWISLNPTVSFYQWRNRDPERHVPKVIILILSLPLMCYEALGRQVTALCA